MSTDFELEGKYTEIGDDRVYRARLGGGVLGTEGWSVRGLLRGGVLGGEDGGGDEDSRDGDDEA